MHPGQQIVSPRSRDQGPHPALEAGDILNDPRVGVSCLPIAQCHHFHIPFLFAEDLRAWALAQFGAWVGPMPSPVSQDTHTPSMHLGSG